MACLVESSGGRLEISEKNEKEVEFLISAG
jgi:hypothetical protein